MNDTHDSSPQDVVEPKKKMTITQIIAVVFFSDILLAIVVSLVLLINYFSPPANTRFPVKVTYTDEQSVRLLADTLENEGVIRSALVFEGYVRLTGVDRSLKTGVYHFTEAQNLETVVRRIASHDTGNTGIRITIPEGFTREQMSYLFASKLEAFDPKEFLLLSQKKEGYLFPDTYMFDIDATAKDVIDKMTETFDIKTKELFASKTDTEIHQTLTMASILEEEGKALEDKRIIAGILERRMKIGMRLQVDATFLYINGKTTYELTSEDLKVDSPYNTYKHAGLPPGPISSPGLVSIQAALTPVDMGYLYYLTDKKGNFYYAKTHDVHVENKRKYMHL